MVGVNQDDRSLEEGDVLGDNSDVQDSQMSQGLLEEELMQEKVERDERTPGGSDCDEDGKEDIIADIIVFADISKDDDISKDKKENDPYTQEEMEAKAKLLYSKNGSDLLEPVTYFRKMLSVQDPPITKVIDLNVLPRFVQLLSCAEDPALRVSLLDSQYHGIHYVSQSITITIVYYSWLFKLYELLSPLAPSIMGCHEHCLWR